MYGYLIPQYKFIDGFGEAFIVVSMGHTVTVKIRHDLHNKPVEQVLGLFSKS